MIFDVKFYFTRKSRFVVNGYISTDLYHSNYSGAASRYTMRIYLTYLDLHVIDIMEAGICDVYLQAPIYMKYWTVLGPEFGSELKVKKAYIVRSLYGNKKYGLYFINHLRDCMENMGSKSCHLDPYFLLRTQLSDTGENYYEYILIYVHDCLLIS